MSVNHKDIFRVRHILDAVEKLIQVSENKSFEDFQLDITYQFASIKLLEIIGEASNHISKSTKEDFPVIPWKELYGLRNILVHEYFGIDLFTIWDIIQNSIPELKIQFESIWLYLLKNN